MLDVYETGRPLSDEWPPKPSITERVRAATSASAEALFLLPFVALVTAFVLIPAGVGLVHSFYSWVPGVSSTFVGFKNYLALASSGTFRQIMANEGFFLLGVPLWIVAPLAIAVLLYERVACAALFRTIFFFPAVLPPAIIGLVFRGLLSPNGAVNRMLGSVGLGGLQAQWIDNPTLVKPVLIAVILWASMGGGVLIFSAALSAVPPELFEAAEIDGASWLQRFRYVTLPSLRPVILLYGVLQIATVFLYLFGWIYTVTSGGPGYSSTTLDYQIYTDALQNGYFGMAAAEAGYLLVLVTVLILVASRVTKLRTLEPS